DHRKRKIEEPRPGKPCLFGSGNSSLSGGKLNRHSISMKKNSGFSLLELMIVLIIVLVIAGAVFSVINLALARTSAEQTKIDLFQEAREFMDQMSLDLRQAGYPSPRNMDPSLLTQNPIINDSSAAAGLVKVGDGDLWFEGDVDGSGTVSVVRYHLDNTGTG